MKIPKLIKQSAGLKKIPNPEDFGLAFMVGTIFSKNVSYPSYSSDFIEGKGRGKKAANLLRFAKDILYRPETDVSFIKSRQELLKEFMDNKELTDFVLGATIDSIGDDSQRQNQIYYNRCNRAKGYFSYLTGLETILQKTNSPELTILRQNISNELNSERIKQLKTALDDDANRGTLEIELTFTGEKHKDYRDKWVMKYSFKKLLLKCIFNSSKEVTERFESDNSKIEGAGQLGMYYTRNGDIRSCLEYLEVPYHNLCYEALDQITKKGTTLWNKNDEVTLNFSITECQFLEKEHPLYSSSDSSGQLREIVSGRVTFEKKVMFGSKKQFNTEYLDFGVGHSVVNGGFGLHQTMWMQEFLSREYTSFLREFDKDIDEFAKTVIELRYLATAANYFNKLKDNRVSLTEPVIRPVEERAIKATRLIEPTLLYNQKVKKVVGNDIDIDSSNNILLIYGPNANGKTRFSRAIPLNMALFQGGLLNFSEHSEMSPCDNIYSLVVEKTNGSRHARDLLKTSKIIRKATGSSLIYMDEPYSGTDSTNGLERLRDTLSELARFGPTVIIPTHFHGITSITDTLSRARNYHCVLDSNNGYTYEIKPGVADGSYETLLAKKLGVDRAGLNKIINRRAARNELKLV